MKNIIARRGLFVALGSIAATVSTAALASDVVTLRRGTYVQADTACAEASNATMRTFTGRGFDSASAAECVARPVAGRPGSYAQTCTGYRQPAGAPKARSTDMFKLHVLSPTSYKADGVRFRLCPGVQ